MARMESKHDLRPSRETQEQDQELVDAALFEAAKEGDLHAAFIAIHKGADLSAPHDVVRNHPSLFCCFLFDLSSLAG
jgi:hypothetical protein